MGPRLNLHHGLCPHGLYLHGHGLCHAGGSKVIIHTSQFIWSWPENCMESILKCFKFPGPTGCLIWHLGTQASPWKTQVRALPICSTYMAFFLSLYFWTDCMSQLWTDSKFPGHLDCLIWYLPSWTLPSPRCGPQGDCLKSLEWL